MSNARKLADNLPSVGQLGDRNILINGQMTIAQRNTAAHNEGNGYFALDRWHQEKSGTDQFTYSVEQVSDAPSGFSKSLKVTTSTAETALAADEFSRIRQVVEGHNLERIGFGTSDAKPLTLSFWVKSTITGNWSASLYVYDTNKIYSQAYTINSANTWEYKTLTYPALTSGAPAYDNSGGLILNFGLFAGSNWTTATTEWTAYGGGANLLGGQTANLGGTLNATWQITGCQLETGSQSTPFEHELISTTLEKCQRYYHNSFHAGKVPGTDTANENQTIVTSWNDGNCPFPPYPTIMRGVPTITLRSRNTTNTGKVTQDNTERSAYVSGIGTKQGEYVSISGGVAAKWTSYSYECDAEL